EARAVAPISHPHIVTVIDAGEDEGRPYIVFEYVEGETLKACIRRTGGLPVSEAVAYAIEIARALGCAHANHVVHRDVKPQNVLIDPEGSAKVTDFGIARTLDEDGLTADGRVLGTTDYVSPEQALGHLVTGQSDLYSLGIVLWEMLTGHVPYRGENQVAVAMKHVRDPLPDIQQHRPEVSAALAAVIDQATAKDLGKRYRTAEAMVADLEDVLAIETARSGHATGEATAVLRTLPGRSKRRLPLRMRAPGLAVAAIVLIIAIIAVAVVLLLHRTHRGTGTLPQKPPAAQVHQVSLRDGAAHDFDPLGDDDEHSEETKLAVDGDASTFWSTETYQDGNLAKPGVGIYADAKPKTKAKFLRVISPRPGYTADVFVADSGPPHDLSQWTKVGHVAKAKQTQDIALRPGPAHRYYLLWITKLPAGKDNAQIAEIAIYR
ncbi:MAG TPA: protein kinase, partial [Solirubrobacteraceae bacterium]